MKKTNPKKISIVKSYDNLVYTSPPSSLLTFLNQRSRWASKASDYTDKDSLLLSILVFGTSLILILALFGLPLQYSKVWFVVLLFGLKTIADIPLLAVGLNFFGRQKHLFLLPVIQILYPFYICFTALSGQLKLYRWKERIPPSTQK